MRNKRILCSLIVLLTGCTAVEPTAPVESSPETPESASLVTGSEYETYRSCYEQSALGKNYTAAVRRVYDMRFGEEAISVYDLDGVLEKDAETMHLTQHINADGMQSEIEGWYDGSRLYMTYNTVTYYEDMSSANVEEVMLVPVEPVWIAESDIETITETERNDTITFELILTQDAAEKLFRTRYDIYGLDAYENYHVNQGVITQIFYEGNVLTSEEALFRCGVTSGGIDVDVTAETRVGWLKQNTTSVVLSDAQAEEFAGYVHYSDIDTATISDADVTEDYAEDSTIATFKKRLISRLNYTLMDDGTYETDFNETESYRIDFSNSLFIYSNRTSRYVYNWRGNQGGFGDACSIDFDTGKATDGCDESVLEQMTNVRDYFLMELYYCGLSLDDLKAEQ
ncbi:MAG: hypothetical protein IJ225_08855 [Solobacterium sp.]|nr:hypothetical protein [Solobacterium sp.]